VFFSTSPLRPRSNPIESIHDGASLGVINGVVASGFSFLSQFALCLGLPRKLQIRLDVLNPVKSSGARAFPLFYCSHFFRSRHNHMKTFAEEWIPPNFLCNSCNRALINFIKSIIGPVWILHQG
jgi:hypothetical protein